MILFRHVKQTLGLWGTCAILQLAPAISLAEPPDKQLDQQPVPTFIISDATVHPTTTDAPTGQRGTPGIQSDTLPPSLDRNDILMDLAVRLEAPGVKSNY